MPQSTARNFIEGKHRELNRYFVDDLEYKELYRGVENQTLQLILSTTQKHLVDLFEKMNSRLPTKTIARTTGQRKAGSSNIS